VSSIIWESAVCTSAKAVLICEGSHSAIDLRRRVSLRLTCSVKSPESASLQDGAPTQRPKVSYNSRITSYKILQNNANCLVSRNRSYTPLQRSTVHSSTCRPTTPPPLLSGRGIKLSVFSVTAKPFFCNTFALAKLFFAVVAWIR